MTILQQLNKVNQAACIETSEASTYTKSIEVFKKYEKGCEKYRTKLLSSLEGKVVEFKGFLVAEHSYGNFSVVLIDILYKGVKIDTLHHLNLYKDLLSSDTVIIGGRPVQGEGKYSMEEMILECEVIKTTNKANIDSMKVEGKGIVYCYKGKWSIGTQRQIDYANSK